jgi:hypothetical protein
MTLQAALLGVTPLSTLALSTFAACANRATPSTPKNECGDDSDCTDGLTCQETIVPACDVCDGGPEVRVCRRP